MTLGWAILEEIPQKLVVDFVVVLHFGGFDESAKQPGAAVGSRALQVRITALHVSP